ncbi:CidA/LrgA family protein [Pseudomonas sp. C11]|uniref:CidA/LrgA family protein n=1 Tax=Pseudomonas sp. C11 TaxID=3075550 RepID=UPI002B000C94|nr:CidA/LrgA family protein [Pseudomonas sp. C11]
MSLLWGIAWLVVFQILGTMVSAALVPFTPGPIVGLVLMLLMLAGRRKVAPALEEAAGSLLKLMPLLLVPAAVGVMAYFSVIEQELWRLIGTLVLSLLPSMIFAGWLMQFLVRRKERQQK